MTTPFWNHRIRLAHDAGDVTASLARSTSTATWKVQLRLHASQSGDALGIRDMIVRRHLSDTDVVGGRVPAVIRFDAWMVDALLQSVRSTISHQVLFRSYDLMRPHLFYMGAVPRLVPDVRYRSETILVVPAHTRVRVGRRMDPDWQPWPMGTCFALDSEHRLMEDLLRRSFEPLNPARPIAKADDGSISIGRPLASVNPALPIYRPL